MTKRNFVIGTSARALPSKIKSNFADLYHQQHLWGYNITEQNDKIPKLTNIVLQINAYLGADILDIFKCITNVTQIQLFLCFPCP